jgi:hypothetical protein
MAEGVDQAEEAISQTIATEIAPPSRPRDQAGKFVQTTASPEPMFGEREIEGGSDAGDDSRRRSREVEVQRGKARRQDDRDDVHGSVDTGPERFGFRPSDDDAPLDDDERAIVEGRADEVVERAPDAESGDEKYEVIIDGQPHEVTLQEALNGYVRTETFHQRMGELNNIRLALEEDHQRQQQNWQLLMQAKEAYENDVRTMMPPEPDWDREFAINPQEAHRQQKIYQGLYAKLTQSQNERAQMQAVHDQEADRRLKKYAVDGFSRFVFDSKIPDKPTLEKEIASMRRTALAAGFSEQEVATVYDPRMLFILRKASKYDRMMAAAKPQAVVPGRGKTLTPGAATPLGNAPRKSLDEANRRLASSGRLEDATEVFRRML